MKSKQEVIQEAYTLLENGVSMDLSKEQVDKLMSKNLIYLCPECKVYHIRSRYNFSDIDNALK